MLTAITASESSFSKELPYWLALHRYLKVGPAHFQKLLEKFGSLSCLFKSGSPAPELFNFLQQRGVENLSPDWRGVEKDLAFAKKENCHILTWLHPNYPILLKQLKNPPTVLFVEGDVSLLNSCQLAIVGSRNPTPTGLENAYFFAAQLANNGLTITSGLALGVDGASHRGAIDAKGKTVAVIGCGLDIVYPASHKMLAREIVEQQGALVSEFPIGTPPCRQHFPRRNRVLSGLSMGVLVVEAAIASGSLITARYAVEQGREVFAIPGSPHNPLSKGCHELIRQGAKLVEDANHILEELMPLKKYVSFNTQKLQNILSNQPIEESLNSTSTLLLPLMGYECTTIDTLIERSGLTADEVSSMLLELEILGKVASVPGGYVRIN